MEHRWMAWSVAAAGAAAIWIASAMTSGLAVAAHAALIGIIVLHVAALGWIATPLNARSAASAT